MNMIDETSSALAAMSTKSGKNDQKTSKKKTQHHKRNVTCHYCQKLGHLFKDCYKRKRESGNQNGKKLKNHGSTSEAFAAEMSTDQILRSDKKDTWLLDGASGHMIFRRDWFSEIHRARRTKKFPLTTAGSARF